MTTDLVKFEPTEAAIATLSQKYMPLKINGIDDKEGFALVHAARMDIKAKRVSVEKRRKELKADALEYGRKVDAAAKKLFGLLEPIESHLTAEEARIEAEKEEIRMAAVRKAEAEERVAKEAAEAEERARREAEAAAIKAEQEKLAQERAALEAEKARVMEEQAKIEAERRRIADEEAARQRAIQEAEEKERRRLAAIEEAKQAEIRRQQRETELAKAREEAAEKARIETEQRLAREAKAKAEADRKRAEAAEKRRKRQEALRPDKEKLLAVRDAVLAIVVPAMSGEAIAAEHEIVRVLRDTAERIACIVEGL